MPPASTLAREPAPAAVAHSRRREAPRAPASAPPAVSGQSELLELFATREIVRTGDVYDLGIETMGLTRLVRAG